MVKRVKGLIRGLGYGCSAVALACTLAACGGGEESAEEGRKDQPSDARKSEGTQGPDGKSKEVDTASVIGELRGPNGVLVQVHSAVRDPGGFVTVEATLKNEGSKAFDPVRLRSLENSIKSKSDISGATLVDKDAKKRYLVLRDTDGQCLCTTSISLTGSGESRPLFAQFPAPPNGVVEVEFQLPTMTPATLELTEG
ncbi:hypothetical protein O7609_17475 [Streptomyces sp. WMMC1477]|nr:hypothetical protein [Streptomyces sp. WMMC1477]MCZ7433406.1 hypothetical protein [Streptomyces sp. WMMC1477]